MHRKMLLIIGAVLIAGTAQVQAEEIVAGKAKFAESCAHCHGASGQGMASFPSLAGRDADYITKRLGQYRAGENVGSNSALMIPMAADLSDDDISNLSAYISTTFQ